VYFSLAAAHLFRASLPQNWVQRSRFQTAMICRCVCPKQNRVVSLTTWMTLKWLVWHGACTARPFWTCR